MRAPMASFTNRQNFYARARGAHNDSLSRRQRTRSLSNSRQHISLARQKSSTSTQPGTAHASERRRPCSCNINIMIVQRVDGPQGPEAIAWAEQWAREQEMESGYRTQQVTKPQTLSYAIMDSPAGVVDLLQASRGRRSHTVTRRSARRSADSGGTLSGRAVGVAATLLRRAGP